MKSPPVICCFFLLILRPAAFSQPAFTSADEIRVSQAPTKDSAVSLAVNREGASWVVWGEAVQWLRPDLSFLGPNKPISQGIAPIALPDGRWAVIRPATNSFGMLEYRYYIYADTSFSDTTSILWRADLRFEGGVTKKFNLRYVAADVQPGKVDIFFTPEYYKYYDDGPMWSDVADSARVVWNFSTGTSLKRINPAFDWTRPLWLIAQTSPEQRVSGSLPWCVYSQSRNRITVSYAREGPDFGFYREQSVSQSIIIYDAQTDARLNVIPLDSVSSYAVDLSQKIILGRNNVAHLLNRGVRGDSLGVTTIALDGTGVSPWKCLVQGIRTVFNTFPFPWQSNHDLRNGADYSIQALDDGTFVLAWTRVQAGGGTDVYAARLNENMDVMGVPKRVNSDTTGDQYSPCLAVKGDTVYVAWLDGRNGGRHVYLRRFPADRITSVTQACMPPLPFAIQSIYPHPVRESGTMTFTTDRSSAVSVRLYDLHGRELKTLYEGDEHPGPHAVRFDIDALPSGVYRIVLQSGLQVYRKNFVIMR